MSAPAAGPAAASVTDSRYEHMHSDDAAERRPQPRHLHDGPSPAGGAADSAAGTQTQTAAPPPAAMLYRHALESIFSFLDQRELATALQVSHGWLAAAQSMASLRLTIEHPDSDLRTLATSTMGRHVSQLGRFGHGNRVPFNHADALRILARHMPHLFGLACELFLPPAHVPLFFPAALRKLEIDLRDSAVAAHFNNAMQSIGRLKQLESLALLLPPDLQISFAPLAALERLRVLDIRTQFELELSDTQVYELRDLPHLQKLKVDITTTMLQHLLRQPHNLQWQWISLPYPLDDEVAALLPLLPSLTEIGCGWTTCERFDWLRRMPNLTDLYLDLADEDIDGPIPGRAEALVAGLQHCANIESLKIHNCRDLTAAQLTDVLPRLSRLRELQLRSLSIDSLFFLSQPPMTTQLSSLRLFHCTQLPPAELRHVHSLRGLHRLSLDVLARSLYEASSASQPQLRLFLYEP